MARHCCWLVRHLQSLLWALAAWASVDACRWLSTASTGRAHGCPNWYVGVGVPALAWYLLSRPPAPIELVRLLCSVVQHRRDKQLILSLAERGSIHYLAPTGTA